MSAWMDYTSGKHVVTKGSCKELTYRCNNTAIVHAVPMSGSEEVWLHKIGLHGHCTGGTVESLLDDLLHRRRLNLACQRCLWCRLGSGSLLLGLVESIALGQTPVAVVLQPVVLVIPGVRRQIQKAKSALKWAMELIPANSNTGKMQSSHALSHGLPVVVAAADRWDGELGGRDSGFDEASADRMWPNFDPDSLVANGGNLLSVLQSRQEVDCLSGGPADIVCVQRLTVENNSAEQWRDDRQFRLLEENTRLRNGLKVVQNRVGLLRVKGKRDV